MFRKKCSQYIASQKYTQWLIENFAVFRVRVVLRRRLKCNRFQSRPLKFRGQPVFCSKKFRG